MEPRAGILVVVSGPSGTGKTSICKQLLERLPNATWSVSATTRPIRGHERDGVDYHFVTADRFAEMVRADELLEHATYLGHRYGTPRAPVEQAVRTGRVVVMEIDVQGARQVAEQMPRSVRIFVLPPTLESLRARLEGRRTESEELQAKRLAQADGEIAFAQSSGIYTHFITNDILEDSVSTVVRIVEQEMSTA